MDLFTTTGTHLHQTITGHDCSTCCLACCSTDSCTRMPPSITGFIHRVIPLNECSFSNPLGVIGRESPLLKLRAVGLSYSGDHMRRFDTIYLAFNVVPTNKCPPFLTLWGLLAGESPTYICWHWSVHTQGTPMEDLTLCLALASFH